MHGSLARYAASGVRIRVLVDDGDTVAGHPSVEVRAFNPFAYRMHNKLLVVDKAAALIGGRNIGNQYFQMDPYSQFADDDVFSVGPVVAEL